MRRVGKRVKGMALLLAVALFATSFHAWNLTAYAADGGDLPAAAEMTQDTTETDTAETDATESLSGTTGPEENGELPGADNAESVTEGKTGTSATDGTVFPEIPGPVDGNGTVTPENTGDPGQTDADAVPDKPEVLEITDGDETLESVPALYGQSDEAFVVEEDEESVALPGLPDAETLYEDYFNRIMYPEGESASSGLSVISGSSVNTAKNANAALKRAVPRMNVLSGNEQRMYQLLKEQITLIANGERDNAIINIYIRDVLDRMTFTFEELGVTDPSTAKDRAKDYVYDTLLPVTNVIRTLLADVPYELYWYDKTVGTKPVRGWAATVNESEQTVTIANNAYRGFKMYVSTDYAAAIQDPSDPNPLRVDTVKTGATKAAADNARDIVNAAKAQPTDYDRVRFFKETICDLTSYNHAANAPAYPYGDPWQLVHVFDNNAETNVVCEGYSKAFKYLCDLTEFNDDRVEAYIAAGQMGNSSAFTKSNHMWNILRMDDGNYYHVDITNCDAEAPSAPDDDLFLKGYEERVDSAGEKAEGFRYMAHGVTPLYFMYDPLFTMALFSAEELEMSPHDYEPTGWITVTLDMGDGTFVTKTITRTKAYGILPDAPEKAGYTFDGWYTAEYGGEKITEADYVEASASNQTLYPRYAPARLTVTFDANGGLSDPLSPSSKKVLHQALYGALPVPEPDPKSFEVFAGWFTEQTGGERVKADTPVTATADHTLYAHWETDEELEKAAEIAFHDSALYYGDYESLEHGGLWIYGLQFKEKGVKERYEYTGAAVKPAFTVYFRDRKLTEGVDYTVQFKNNVKAAKYDAKNAPTVVVKGKGNYSGTITHPFEIHPADIADPQITLPLEGVKDKDDNQVPHITIAYNGKAQKPGVKIVSMLGGKAVTLKAGTDYVVEYDEAKKTDGKGVTEADYDGGAYAEIKAPGFYLVPVKGKGNYGEDIDEDGVVACESRRYLLVEVVVTTDKNANATGALKRTMISSVSIPAIPAQEYVDGFAYVYGTPASGERVLRNAKDTNTAFDWKLYDRAAKKYLEQGTDYILQFENNDAVGTATVTVTGIGDYAGSVKKTFAIKGIALSKTNPVFQPPASANDWWDGSRIVYTGAEIKPAGDTAKGENGNWVLTDPKTQLPLQNGTDYTVSYTNNVKPGTATIIFTGKKAYEGTTVKKTFKIAAYNLKDDPAGRVNVKLVQSKPVYRKGGVKPEPVVSYTFDGMRRTLVAGTDYTLKYANNTVANGKKTPTVTIAGKGCFAGTLAPLTFEIVPADIGYHVTVSAADLVYRKKANICKPSVVLTDKKTGAKLQAGTDYEKAFTYMYATDNTVVSHADDSTDTRMAGDPVDVTDIIPAGTKIRVSVTGKGNYTGTAQGTFSFTAASLSNANIAIANQTYTGKRILVTDEEQFTKAQIRTGGVTEQLKIGTHFEVVPGSYVNNTAAGAAKVTLRGIPENGYGGTKTVSFKIVKKSMDYTVKYNVNLEAIANGLGISVEEAGNRFRVTGTMADSVTTEGGRLRKNAYRVYDTYGGAYLPFMGWETDFNGVLYENGGVFNPGRQQWYRRFFGNTYNLHAKWDLTDCEYRSALQAVKKATVTWDKVVCIGDNLTASGYPQYMQKMLKQHNPSVEVLNMGVNGATVHRDYKEQDYEQRLEEIIKGFDSAVTSGTDAVFLMAGTIDWLSTMDAFSEKNRPIGDITTEHTFKYDFNLICDALRTKFAGAEIFIVLPPPAHTIGNRAIDEFRTAEREVAALYQADGFQVIDRHLNTGMLTSSVPEVKKQYYANFLFLTAKGNDALASFILEQALGLTP